MIVSGINVATCTDEQFTRARNLLVWDCMWTLVSRCDAFRARTEAQRATVPDMVDVDERDAGRFVDDNAEAF
jgi:hypothetical protein